MDVKPQHTDINTYLLNQLENDEQIYRPIHDSQKQINTNRLINSNQAPERLKQTTVKKTLHKGKYRLVTMQQQKTNGKKNAHLQIKIHNEYLKKKVTNTKIDKYKKLNITSTTEHKTEHNYHFGETSNKYTQIQQRSNQEIDRISNNKRQRFKGSKTDNRKMNQQKIQLNYNKNHYTEQNKPYKNKDYIIKDKKQLNSNKHNIGPVSKLLITLNGNHKKPKRIVHHKLKEYRMQYNSMQKLIKLILINLKISL